MTSSTEKAMPRESATVILVRQGGKANWEIFLARRHKHQSFMAGAYVFPGGQVDAADSDPEISSYISTTENFDPQALLQDVNITQDMAQSLFICAIRETFEETGVLLAQTFNGNFIQLDSTQDLARFAAYRRELNSGKITLKEIGQRESLLFSLSSLLPYAHWITPEIAPKRFSTRFFLASLPDGQSATTDSDELTDFLWVTPGDALQMHLNKKIMLMPPTLKTLEELSAFVCIDELLDHIKNRVIYPILPQLETNILKLPHDPEYSIEKYKIPVKSNESSRLIFTDGIWQTEYCRNK